MMHLNCPHCHQFIEVVNDHELETPVTCPSCGSEWKTWDTETATFRTASSVTVGRFELLNRLGQGQFGEVWSARDPKLDRQVAIKLPRKEALDDTDIERFLREARAAAQLHHPNIVGVLEVGEDGRSLYIVSDLIQGVNLADRLAMGWKPSFQETAQLCLTLAEALEHAHSKGVIHRDLKPANVMVDNKNQIFLTDFGLAKRQAGEITMTIEGRIFGTPAYMPPEQARGDGHNADARSDVYSLGIMLFELLTGQRPFKGGSQMLIHQILTQDPSPLRRVNPNVPVDMQTICIKCLEKDPAQRYQTAQEVADELRRYLAGESIHARPTPLTTRLGRWAKRNRKLAWLAASCLALVMLLGVVGTHSYQKWKQDQPAIHNVLIKTYPEGARVVCVPLDPTTGEPMPEKKIESKSLSPTTMPLSPGDYLIEVEVTGHGFHEVLRRVPVFEETELSSNFMHFQWKWSSGNSLTLPTIIIPNSPDLAIEMIKCPGGSIKLLPAASQKSTGGINPKVQPRMKSAEVHVAPFWIQARETTKQDAILFIQERCKLPREVLDEWYSDLEDCESLLSLINPGSQDVSSPVNLIDYNLATTLAEIAGMRLMTETEYLHAATNGGRSKYPWGDVVRQLDAWPISALPNDVTTTPPGIRGLYSGVAEWTQSWNISLPTEPNYPSPFAPNLFRAVRGAPPSGVFSEMLDATEALDGPQLRFGQMVTVPHQRIGFRLVRSVAPRFLTLRTNSP